MLSWKVILRNDCKTSLSLNLDGDSIYLPCNVEIEVEISFLSHYAEFKKIIFENDGLKLCEKRILRDAESLKKLETQREMILLKGKNGFIFL